jgi:hypothetical protein
VQALYGETVFSQEMSVLELFFLQIIYTWFSASNKAAYKPSIAKNSIMADFFLSVQLQHA